MHKFVPVLLGLSGVFLFLAVTLFAAPRTAQAATNSTINFQAKLMSAAGAIAPDGNYNVEFKLYTTCTAFASDGSNCSTFSGNVWTEDHLNSASQGIQVKNGYLTTSLGSITAFPSTINWDQQLWITMNIGGTSTGTVTWDTEMTPALKLTAVPYALAAGQLQTTSGANTSKLSIQAPTGGNQTFVIQDQGAAGTYNLLTQNQMNSSFVQLQSSTPGTPQTGNLNISGTAIVNTLQASSGTVATLNATTGLNTGSGSGTQRLDASGNLLNIATISTSGSLATTANSVTTYQNVYSWGTTTATKTGTLEIILPNGWNSSMLRFSITGYDYSGVASWRTLVSGYNYSTTPAWNNTSAEIGGGAPFTSVRLGYDSSLSKNVLLLGTTTTTWNYPQFNIDEVLAGYSNQGTWGSGYSSAFLTSEASITNIVSPTVQTIAYTSNTFLQGGNSFGATAVLGTNDNNSVSIKTNGTTRFTIDTSGNGTLTGGLTTTGVSSASGSNLSITAAGTGGLTLTSGSGTITTSNAIKAQALNATGYTTSSTSSTYGNQWTKLGYCTITAQYNACHSQVMIVNASDGQTTLQRALVDIRVKQQAVLGSAPQVQLDVSNASGILPSNLTAITTVNTGTTTTVELWGQIVSTYMTWSIEPIINTDTTQFTWLSNQSFVTTASLPAGTQTAAIYAPLYANNGTIQTATNTTSAFLVQNSAGANLLQADTSGMQVNINYANFNVTGLSAPSAAPAVAVGSNSSGSFSGASGTNYYYKVVATNNNGSSLSAASAESTVFSSASFTPISAPTAATAALDATAGVLTGAYSYEVTFVTANGETTAGTASNSVTASAQTIDLSGIPLGPTGTTARKIYRTQAGGSTYMLDTTINDNTTTTLTADNVADASLGATPPGSNTARTNTNSLTITFNTVTGATGYRIYRGTTSGSENAYQTTTTSPFIDTGAAGTAGTPPGTANDGNITASGTYNTNTFTGNTLTFGSASAATIQSASNQSLTVQSGGTGAITVQSAATTASGSVTIASGNASSGVSGTVSIDNGTFTSGTPAINIGTTNARSITIGTNSTTTTINAAAAGTLNAGSGVTTGTINLGTGLSSGTLNIDTASSGAGTLNIATGSTQTTAVNIGTGTGTQTYHLADGAGVKTVTLGSTSNSSTTTIQGGTGNVNLVTTSSTAGTIVKTSTSNSTTAFQVQNAAGIPIFLVDTSTTANLVTNPGFEVNVTTGWTGTNATLTRNTTKGQYFHGVASASVNVTTAGGGATVNSFTATLNAGTQYTLSFYAENSTAGALGLTFTGGTSPTCTLNSTAMVTTGFQRYYCSFTPTTTAVTAITITSSTTGLFYLDGVEVNTGATPAPYGAQGAIQLRGIINSPATFQSSSNSTTAFQIQDSTGTANTFIADTLNNQVLVNSLVTGSLNASSTGGTVTTNLGTLQRTAAGTTIVDLKDSGNTTLQLMNSGSGVANLNLYGGSLTTGSTPVTRIDNSGNFYGNGSNLTSLSGSNISSGTVGVAYGGTGVSGSSAANGSLLIGNGSGYTLSTLTAGTGISISNAAGSITINGTGAAGSAGGDLTGTYPNPTIAKLQGTTVTIGTLTGGNFLQYNGTAWVNQSVSGDVSINSSGVSSIGTGKVTSTMILDGTIANADLSSGTFSNITGTGALAAGSIASGFGTIATANTITGTTLNGTTGINTGAGAGTQRIDASGNLVNINNASVGGTITLGNFNSLKATVGTGTVMTSDPTQISQSPTGNEWHDLLAFNKLATPTFEQYNVAGASWGTSTLNSNLFAEKQAQSIQIFDGTTYNAARWTWNSSSFAYSSGGWLSIGFAYTSPSATKSVLFETSTDGVTWTTRHSSTGNNQNGAPAWFYVQSYGGDTYLRLTITGTSSGSVNLTGIQLLTNRWGDQGSGSEISLPYSWDASQNITTNGTLTSNGTLNVSNSGNLNIGGTTVFNSSRVLQNVASVTGTLTPTTTNSYDLGTSSTTWRTGYFGTNVQAPAFDAISGALTLGASNASSIGIGKSGITTTITGGLTQQTGAFSLTGNAASSLTATSGGLTIDTTTTAGQTIAIGNSNITHTIQIGTNSGSAQTVSIGSTNASSTLTLNAGNGISVNGNVTGSGTITGTTLNGTTGINTGAGAGTQRIDSNGNLNSIGLITVQGAINSSDSVTFNHTFQQGSASSTYYYKLATLPASGNGTYDHLRLTATLNTAWGSNQNSYIDATFANRNSFTYQYKLSGASVNGSATLVAYKNADTSVDIYIVMVTGYYTSASYSILENEQETVYANPYASRSTTAPTGTLAFDASVPATYPPATYSNNSNNFGVNTASPVQMLDVQGGNINTSGSLMTANTTRIDNSGNFTATSITNSGTYNGNTFTNNNLTFSGASAATVSSASGQNLNVYADSTGALTLGQSASTGTSQTIGSTGDTIKTGTNSTTAFQVQNASNVGLLTADTTNGQVVLNGTNNNTELVIKANASQTGQTPQILLQNSNGNEIGKISVDSNNNQFFGMYTGKYITTGTMNNAFGDGDLQALTSGSQNTVFGDESMTNITTGSQNAAFSDSVLGNLTTGNGNTGFGHNSLSGDTSGGYNTGLGYGSGSSNTTGGANTFLGYRSGGGDDDSFASSTVLQNSTTVGAYAQVQANNSVVIGGIGSDATNVGIGTTIPTNTFSVSPLYYNGGQASVTSTSPNTGTGGTTVTGTGTNWTSTMVGMQFIFANGQTGTITAVGGTTSLTLSVSQPITSVQNYRIHTIGFQVTNGGNAYIQNSSTTAFQVQNSAGTSFLTADSTNQIVTTKDLNVGSSSNIYFSGRLFSDGFESNNFKLWDGGTTANGSGSISISGTTVRNGNFAAKIINNSGTAYATATIASTSIAYMRGYVYVSSQTANNMDMMSLNGFALFRDTSGNMYVYNSATAAQLLTSGNISANAWHEIQLEVSISSTTGVLKAWLDNNVVYSTSSANTGTTNLTSFHIGDASGATTRTSTEYIDDVVVDTGAPGDSSSLMVNDSLHVAGTSSFGGNLLLKTRSDNAAAFQIQNNAGTSLLTASTSTMGITIDGNSHSSVLTVGDGSETLTFNPGLYWNGSSMVSGSNVFNLDLPGTQVLNFSDNITTLGTMCINVLSCTHTLGINGTTAGTSAFVTGTPDIAEYITTAPGVSAYDVVAADPNNSESVVKATTGTQGAMVGVISDGTSGFMMENAHYGQAFNAVTDNTDVNAKPMTLAGRIPVHVTTENGPIEPGDYLTASSTPGYAMKATHGGPTIGKALGFFDGTSGNTVLALINLSYYDPTDADHLQASSGTFDTITGNVATINNLVVNGTATISTLNVTGDATIQGKLTVRGAVSVPDITVNGHLMSAGNAPTITLGDAAGATSGTTGPNNTTPVTAPVATLEGTDTTGTITINTGDTNVTDGVLLHVKFDKAYSGAYKIVLGSDNAITSKAGVYSQKTTDGFDVLLGTTPNAKAQYQFDYVIMGLGSAQ